MPSGVHIRHLRVDRVLSLHEPYYIPYILHILSVLKVVLHIRLTVVPIQPLSRKPWEPGRGDLPPPELLAKLPRRGCVVSAVFSGDLFWSKKRYRGQKKTCLSFGLGSLWSSVVSFGPPKASENGGRPRWSLENIDSTAKRPMVNVVRAK